MYPTNDVDHWSRIIYQRQSSISFSWSTFIIAVISVVIVVLLSNCLIFFLASESGRLEIFDSKSIQAEDGSGTKVIASTLRMANSALSSRIPTHAQGAIIDSPTRTYSIPTTFMKSRDDSHILLDHVEQATQRNTRLWNEEDRRKVRFEPDVADFLEPMNIESTIEDNIADSIQGDELATQIGRTRLSVKTRTLYDDEETRNLSVTNESANIVHSIANENFELRNFIFYPSHRISTNRTSTFSGH